MWLPTVDFESTASAVSPPRHARLLEDAESGRVAGLNGRGMISALVRRFCQNATAYPSGLSLPLLLYVAEGPAR
jgi:hypothetical protein